MPDSSLTISQAPAGGATLTLEQVSFLMATAGRAPSVHNTQPWKFRVHENGLDLYADQGRRLRAIDPEGREMLVSCGGALFGLRLAIRHLGYRAAVELLPDADHPSLLARVRLGREAALSPEEWEMLAAVPHRHTHRGPFSPEPIPAELLPRLQQDAIAEGATLVLVDERSRGRLRDLVTAAARWQQRNPMVRDELRDWTRGRGSDTRDGVPASAYTALPGGEPDTPAGWEGALTQRDFDQGRGEGQIEPGGLPPSVTAILVTAGDTPADWMRAGQALNRVLVHAASTWVFAALNSQPMESPPLRTLVRSRLGLPGAPQMLLEFGRAHTAAATARRPVEDLIV
jgi:nitroreductase